MTAERELINFLYLDPARGLIERRTSSLENYAADFRQLLGCEFLQVFPLDTPMLKREIKVWVDEDYLQKPHGGLWIETAIGVPYAAPAIFTGLSESGQAASCPLQPRELAEHLTAYHATVNLDPITALQPLKTQIKDSLLRLGLEKYAHLNVDG